MNVELLNITKKFGELVANDQICLKANSGEVLALLGENGAGKSTLMKILFGLYQQDDGRIKLNGKTVAIASPNDAIRRGLGMVFQQFNLVPALSVTDNLLLAYPRAPFWTFRSFFGKANARLGRMLAMLKTMAPDIDPNQMVSSLSVGQRQLLELVKVLNLDSNCIILDEPTSVLTPQESSALWKIIRELAGSGRSVILITHKMEDVMACADQIAVMRAGKVVQQLHKKDCTEESLVKMMMGEHGDKPPMDASENIDFSECSPCIQIRSLSVSSGQKGLQPLDLEIRPGEIVGVAGVSGNGQHLLADALMGLLPLKTGEVVLNGRVVQSPHKRTLGPAQFAYIPEQPAVNAVAPDLDLHVNVALSNLRRLSFIPDWGPQKEKTERIIKEFNVKPNNPALAAGKLSGGNLQKLVAGRELEGNAEFIIAAYPTMGLDANAARVVYEAMFRKANDGAAVLWISEDIDDLLEHSHRVAVMFEGKIKAVFNTHETDRYQIGRVMSGGHNDLNSASQLDMSELSDVDPEAEKEMEHVC
jgi:ABC-type uncharacterized transport system ATPase subunit